MKKKNFLKVSLLGIGVLWSSLHAATYTVKNTPGLINNGSRGWKPLRCEADIYTIIIKDLNSHWERKLVTYLAGRPDSQLGTTLAIEEDHPLFQITLEHVKDPEVTVGTQTKQLKSIGKMDVDVENSELTLSFGLSDKCPPIDEPRLAADFEADYGEGRYFKKPITFKVGEANNSLLQPIKSQYRLTLKTDGTVEVEPSVQQEAGSGS